MKRQERQNKILEYLKGLYPQSESPTFIGEYGLDLPYYQASSTVCKELKILVGNGDVDRLENGTYRYIPRESR